MDWQPIETAPKNGSRVLLFGSYSLAIAPTIRTIGFFDTGAHELLAWRSGESRRKDQKFFPSHWMPLPEPPVSDKHKVDMRGEHDV